MRTPDPPSDSPDSGDGPPSYEWLDEWLCEYVDGTMDPSLEAVFEEYVEANPELKAHVERLRQTRELLCNCDFPEEPSTEAQNEVCCKVEGDMVQSSASLPEVASERPMATLGLASSVAVALLVGFLAGAMYVDPAPLQSHVSPDTVVQRSAPDVEPSPPERTPRATFPPPSDYDSMRSASTITTTGAR